GGGARGPAADTRSHGAASSGVLFSTTARGAPMSAFTFHALPPPLAHHARRTAGEPGRPVPGAGDGDGPYPVRCCLRDVEAEEGVLLLSAQPVTASSPYAAPGPIYLHEHACDGYQPQGDVPEILRRRLLSVRAFDSAHMMTGTE